MISREELDEAICSIMKDSNDLESAKTIFEAVAIDNYYIIAGRVNIVKVAMKCILEYLNNPRNLNITETRREMVKFKEIEKSHQEENGKLRVEIEKLYQDNLTLVDGLKQEKEKNKELEEKLKIATAMLTKGTYPEENEGDNDFDKQFISKDKIKEKIAELETKSGGNSYHVQSMINAEKNILKELLEEK